MIVHMNAAYLQKVSRRVFVTGFAAFALTALGACERSGPSRQSTRSFFAFDTVVSVKASCDKSVLDALEERCTYYESLFSRTVESSDVGRINRAGGSSVEVAPETAERVTRALEYCRSSDGLFDITIGAASELWDFKKHVVPDSAALARARQHIDYRCVEVKGNTITVLDPQAKLDLGGIAKGYIADKLVLLLEDAGCKCGFVNLWGNVQTVGTRPDGSAWNVGVRDPNGDETSVFARVSSTGGSVVTSGLYERRFELDGVGYWHILDPKTGYPVQSDIVSATIVSTESIDGDGYTKPLFMLGAREALAWINAHEELQGMLITGDGRALKSANSTIEVL